MIPILVKYETLQMNKRIVASINRVIESTEKKLKFNDPDYEDIFEGPCFPQEAEVYEFVKMCKVIRDNYICVHPLDKEHK